MAELSALESLFKEAMKIAKSPKIRRDLSEVNGHMLQIVIDQSLRNKEQANKKEFSEVASALMSIMETHHGRAYQTYGASQADFKSFFSWKTTPNLVAWDLEWKQLVIPQIKELAEKYGITLE
jgi:hypothetical protein